METITEPQRELPVRHCCDVLVAGGGIAGIAAALAAARTGARVILLEKEWVLGGLGTLGLVTVYLPLCDGCGHQVIFGIGEELLRLSMKHGAEAMYPEPWLQGGTLEEKKERRFQVEYNPHLFAMEAERLLCGEGVKILYGTMAAAVALQGEKIAAVIVENKSRRSAIRAKSVVDCTGDADLFRFSGAETAVFAQKNVLAAWHYTLSRGRLALRPLGAADIPDKRKTGAEPQPLVPRRFTGLEGEELSEMVLLSHEKILEDVLKARQEDPSHTPVAIPAIPQVRMTRRLAGVYTMDDTEVHRAFADSVGLFGDWSRAGSVYELPFRTLYGGKVKNLIAAGRCISVTDAMWDVTRVIPVCALSGQAAGTAAALSDDFPSLDVSRLQAALKKAGVRLHESEL